MSKNLTAEALEGILGKPVIVDVIGVVVGASLDLRLARNVSALLADGDEELLATDQQEHTASCQEDVQEEHFSVHALFQLDDLHRLIVHSLTEVVSRLKNTNLQIKITFSKKIDKPKMVHERGKIK